VGGFFGNLWGGTEAALMGLGTMPVRIGREVYKSARTGRGGSLALLAEPIYKEVLKPAAESYAYQYGPLFEGFGRMPWTQEGLPKALGGEGADYGEFLHRFYENPLGPILDVSAIISGGAAGAARAGLAPAALKRGFIELEAPSGVMVPRPLARQTLRAELQVGTSALLGKLPPTFPKVGEAARAARLLKKKPLRSARARELLAEPYLRALAKIQNPKQRGATFWLSQVPLPADLANLIRILEAEGSESARATSAMLRTPKAKAVYENPTPKMLDIIEEGRGIAEAQRAILGITEETALRRSYMPTLIARGAKIEKLEGELTYTPAPGYASIEDMIAKIDADLEAAGRPKPVYMPHTSEAPSPADMYGAGGGGKGPQRRPGPLRQTMGILLGRGQLIADPQVLRRSYTQSVKYGLYDDFHQLHIEHAVPVDALPRGWQFVRRKHSERIPYTVRTGQDFQDFAKAHLDSEAEFTFTENPFATKLAAEAATDAEGRYLAVPRSFSKELTGEFVRSSRALYLLQKYPVRIWRHLVLKLRPAWLVNNILGNTLLYLLHSSDPVALQELGAAMKRAFPRKADTFDRIMRQQFPEQIHGTFIGSQMPLYQGGRPLVAQAERAVSILGAGLAQVDRVWEQALRSAIVRRELRKSPKIREFAGKMRGQTREEFWTKAGQALKKDPLEVERITNRVNDALGDFLALGRVERDYIRSVFPFYAWYRVITGITLKLPLTHPYKSPLLARLGQAGTQSVLEELGLPDDVIEYAKGFVPVGPEEGGRIPGLSTAAANPLATVPQLSQGVFELAMLPLYISGAKQRPYGQPYPWESLPGPNPFLGVPIEALTGAKSRSGNRYGLLGAIPQFTLVKSLSGRAYTGTPSTPTLTEHTSWSDLLRYAGVPYARISPRRVKQISERQ